MSPHAKHTPGKFLVFHNVSDGIYEVETDDPKSDEEIEATMALLEASPALFEALKKQSQELRRLAEMLAADVRPGHCDHITKQRASDWASSIADLATAALSSAQPEAPTE